MHAIPMLGGLTHETADALFRTRREPASQAIIFD
jgi:hypothetical protein